MRSRIEQTLRLIGQKLATKLFQIGFVEGLHGEERIDEETVTKSGGHASGGSVRTGDKAHFLKVAHDVAYRCGRQLQTGMLGQRARTDRLTFLDIAFDQRFEQNL